MKKQIQPTSSRDQVLTTALLAVMEHLQLTQKELADIIGTSESTITRLKNGSYTLRVDSKEGELSVMLIRIYKSLDPLVGSDQNAIKWLKSYNDDIGNMPLESIKRIEGLSLVVKYLDAMRGIA